MTIYLPQPYPDELIHSVIARYFAHSGVPPTYTRTSQIFGSNHLVDAVMIRRLDLLSQHLCLFDMFAAMHVLTCMTLYPFMCSFLSPDNADRYARAIIEGNVRSSSSLTAALLTNADRKTTLHYCHVCRSEDMKNFGETYWRRTHQLSIVMRCPLHDVPLSPSLAASKAYGRAAYADATRMTQSGSRPHPDPGRRPKSLEDVATRARDLLAGRGPEGPGCLLASIETSLAKVGWDLSVGSDGVGRLAEAMLAFHGPDVLQAMGVVDVHDAARVLKCFLNRKRTCKSPTVGLLLLGLLEEGGTTLQGSRPSLASFVTPTPSSMASKDDAGAVNRSAACAGHDDPVTEVPGVDAAERERSNGGGRRRRRESLASMRGRWEDLVQRAPKPKITNAIKEDQTLYRTLMEKDRAWIAEQKERTYDRFGGRQYRGDLRTPRQGDDDELRARQRAIWRDALREALRPRWSNAIKAHRSIYKGLMKCDRDWMDGLGRVEKESSSRIRGNYSRPWPVVDEELSRRCDALLELLDRTGDTTMTSRAICATLGVSTRSERHVPLTKEKIQRYLSASQSGRS